ncbi:MAG: serine/threonine protein kinase, partial [Acidobacteria bacterium]|nr:serine/threonine protein kinase [Acidobacteriota bacterium]
MPPTLDPERWRQLEPILDEALDLPPGDRSAFLERACGDDAELRRLAEQWLIECETSDGFLEEAGGAYLERVIEASPFDPSALARVGSRLGAFRLLSVLGQGGMGTVFLAERADGQFEQQVAIKVVHHQGLGEDARERFRFERQILARLEHPNIARLLDGGVDADGAPYLVMEYVDGVPLDEYCDARGLSLEQRLLLVADVCRVVAYAHRRQVVHRDLKPS